MTRILLRLAVTLPPLLALGPEACREEPQPVPPGSGEWSIEWSPDLDILLGRLSQADQREGPAREAFAASLALETLGYDGGVNLAQADSLRGAGDDVRDFDSGDLPGAPGRLGAGGTAGSHSSARTWRRAGAPANAVTLRVGDDSALPLLGIEASVWVDGLRARVLLDCVFENVHERQLEGSFKLRLPEGASPYYFAFGEEVWSGESEWALPERDRSLSLGPEPERVGPARDTHWKGAREARMVPRAAAARAYKNTVRKSVDPALMEWAGAGVFQARVFPLAPETLHRVVVGYDVDLAALGGELVLPLDFPAELASLSLDLWAAAPAGTAVRLTPPAPASAAGEREHWSYPATDARSFELRFTEPAGLALVSDEDTGYFAMDLPLAGGFGPESGESGWRGAPYGVFLVDTSLSAADRMPAQLDLLEAILEQNREQLAEFAVLSFDLAPHWWRPGMTPNTAETVRELRAELETLALEGASNLGAVLQEAAHPGWLSIWDGPGWDFFLLSDGAATWGEADLELLSQSFRTGMGGPLFAYTTGQAGTDRRALEHLARESGGALFSVAGPDDLAAAATAHHGQPWRIEELHLAGARDLLLRGRPLGVYPGQRLRLVGRGLPRAGDVVELVLTNPRGEQRTLSYPVGSALRSPLASRAYGEVATAWLEELGSATRGEAEAFATRFRVPGRSCSLLMLESDEDYADHGILAEDEALAARDAEAGAAAEAARADIAAHLGDPLWRFRELLEPLLAGEQPTLALGAGFVDRLAGLPPEAWRMDPGPLRFVSRRAADVPSGVTEALRSGEPDYLLVQDEAARRRAEAGMGDALRVLSSLVELSPGDGIVARDVAQTLVAWGLVGHAYHLYLRVAEARPFEPQSYLALARCAEQAGRGDLALAWYAVAIGGQWDGRFGDFSEIATFDGTHCLRRIARGELEANLGAGPDEWQSETLERLGKVSYGLAVAIEWNTDATDVDLHVLDPIGEHCFYGHRETELGGRLSRDVTQGYGPELYLLPEPVTGEYVVWARYFSSDPNRTEVRTKVLATVYRDWGTEREAVERVEFALEADAQDHGIVRLVLEP